MLGTQDPVQCALCTYKDKIENLRSNDLKYLYLKLRNSHFITIQVVSSSHNRVLRNLKLLRNERCPKFEIQESK